MGYRSDSIAVSRDMGPPRTHMEDSHLPMHSRSDFSRAGVVPARQKNTSASSKPPTEFAQPRLSRVKGRSSPARGYKFGCLFVPYGRSLPGHIGTNARPNLYPLAGDDRPLTLLKRGCTNSVVGLELADPNPFKTIIPGAN